jgi:hypothetical protein
VWLPMNNLRFSWLNSINSNIGILFFEIFSDSG